MNDRHPAPQQDTAVPRPAHHNPTGRSIATCDRAARPAAQGREPFNWIALAVAASAVLVLAVTVANAHEGHDIRIDNAISIDDEAHLPEHFHRYVSEHFVLVTHANRNLAQARLELLEETYTRFFDSFESAGFELQRNGQRLIAVLFDDHDAYVRYAQRADYIDMSWSNGYYSTRTNRVALISGDDRVVMQSVASTAGTERHSDADLLPYGQTGAEAQQAAEASVTTDSDTDAASLQEQVVVKMRPINVASTAHEAAHQLAFNTGLQRRGVMYPLWVAEGLASCFEPQALGDAFGPEFVNINRRRDLVDAIERDELLPLSRLVTLTRLPTHDSQAVTRIYAQTWALFHFLFEHRPEQLSAYLSRLAQLPQGRRSTAIMRSEFIAAFGPVDDLQAQWDAALERHTVAHRVMEAELAQNTGE